MEHAIRKDTSDRLDFFGEEWNAEVAELAANYLSIGVCHACRKPRVEGYVCYFCGNGEG